MTRMRMGARFIVLICMWLFIISGTPAQASPDAKESPGAQTPQGPQEPPDAPQPLDALQSSAENLKGYSYTLDIEYIPDGAEGLGADEEGVYAYTRQTRHFTYSGTFAYHFNDAVSLNAQAAIGSGTSGVQRTYAGGQTKTMRERHNAPLQPSFGFTYRFLRQSDYAPTFSAATGRDGHLQGRLSYSHVRDPTVFSASVGHTWRHGKAGDLLLFLSAGFVANDRVNFTLQAAHGLPRSAVHPPWTTIEVRGVHAVGDTGIHEIGVGLSLSMRGDHPSVGLRITLTGSSP